MGVDSILENESREVSMNLLVCILFLCQGRALNNHFLIEHDIYTAILTTV